MRLGVSFPGFAHSGKDYDGNRGRDNISPGVWDTQSVIGISLL